MHVWEHKDKCFVQMNIQVNMTGETWLTTLLTITEGQRWINNIRIQFKYDKRKKWEAWRQASNISANAMQTNIESWQGRHKTIHMYMKKMSMHPGGWTTKTHSLQWRQEKLMMGNTHMHKHRLLNQKVATKRVTRSIQANIDDEEGPKHTKQRREDPHQTNTPTFD